MNMPSYPDIKGKPVEKQISELENTFIRLSRFVQDALSSVDTTNFTQTFYKTWSDAEGNITTLQGDVDGISADVTTLNGTVYDSAYYRFKSDGFHIYSGGINIWDGTPDVPGTKRFYVDETGGVVIKNGSITGINATVDVGSVNELGRGGFYSKNHEFRMYASTGIGVDYYGYGCGIYGYTDSDESWVYLRAEKHTAFQNEDETIGWVDLKITPVLCEVAKYSQVGEVSPTKTVLMSLYNDFSISNVNDIILDAAYDITLDAGDDIILDAADDITLDADGLIAITAVETVTLTGSEVRVHHKTGSNQAARRVATCDNSQLLRFQRSADGTKLYIYNDADGTCYYISLTAV